MPRLRVLALLAAVLVVPMATAWNFVVEPSHPWFAVHVGKPLAGARLESPVEPSLSAIADRRLQKAVETRVAEALPMSALLVRLNNELRADLFGLLPANITRGHEGHLVLGDYLDEYCARDADYARRNASWAIPRLRDIAAYYRARGAVFIYLITPSKAAHMPARFDLDARCPGDASRRVSTQAYADSLRAAEIPVVDAASMVHAMQRDYPFDLFPRGGIHWNSLAASRATSILVDAINRQVGDALVPTFTYEYSMAQQPIGTDRDLADLSNVLFPALDYPTTRVAYRTPAPCASQSGGRLDVAVIGGSFMHLPVEILTEHSCLSRARLYFYMRAIFGGVPHTRLRTTTEADRQALRTMRIVVLEENEGVMADRAGLGADQVEQLHRLLLASDEQP